MSPLGYDVDACPTILRPLLRPGESPECIVHDEARRRDNLCGAGGQCDIHVPCRPNGSASGLPDEADVLHCVEATPSRRMSLGAVLLLASAATETLSSSRCPLPNTYRIRTPLYDASTTSTTSNDNEHKTLTLWPSLRNATDMSDSELLWGSSIVSNGIALTTLPGDRACSIPDPDRASTFTNLVGRRFRRVRTHRD